VQVSVSARQTEVPERLRIMTEEKIGRLSRYVEGLETAEVHFWEHKNPRIADKDVCEVTIEGHGHHVRCKVQAPDAFQAVDKAYEKLSSQLAKLKTKLHRRYQGAPKGRKGDGSLGAVVPVPDEVTETDEAAPEVAGPRIVKSKRFAMFPMSPEEAIGRMELLGHGFFFFTNADTSRAAVVYKRDDGDIGLIDEAD